MAEISGGVLSIDARPTPVKVVPAKTAVIVVDMQNHFISPGGTWSNCGIDVWPMRALLPLIQRVLTTVRAVNAQVVYLRTSEPFVPPMPAATQPYPADAYQGTSAERWARYCSSVGASRSAPAVHHAGGGSPTWNADIVDELAPLPGDIVVTKTMHSGFFATDLDERLKAAGVESLLFTGCTTSVCVESTLRDVYFRRYDCILLADCVAEPVGAEYEHSNHDATVLLTDLVWGWVTRSDAVLQAFATDL